MPTTILGNQMFLLNLLLLIWGLANLVYGYRLFRLFLALSGAYIGAILATRFFPQASQTLMLVVIVIGAIVTSYFAFALYSLTFALLGGAVGLILGLSLVPLLGLTSIGYVLGLIVFTLLGVALGSVLKDLVIILATSVGGAHLVLTTLPSLLSPYPQVNQFLSNPGTYLLLLVLLSLAGLISQSSHR